MYMCYMNSHWEKGIHEHTFKWYLHLPQLPFRPKGQGINLDRLNPTLGNTPSDSDLDVFRSVCGLKRRKVRMGVSEWGGHLRRCQMSTGGGVGSEVRLWKVVHAQTVFDLPPASQKVGHLVQIVFQLHLDLSCVWRVSVISVTPHSETHSESDSILPSLFAGVLAVS